MARTDGRLVVEYAQSAVVFEGKAAQKLLPVLLPLLDGTNTVDDINRTVGEAAAPAVLKALTMLSERGLLLEGPPLPEDVSPPVADTVHFLAATEAIAPQAVAGVGTSDTATSLLTEAQDLLAGATVAVAGSGPAAHEIAKLLAMAGLGDVRSVGLGDAPASGSTESPEPGALNLAVVAPEPSELPEVEDWNRRALESGTRWLQILPFDGHMAAIGPLYVPGETCCYECYRRRRAANVNFPEPDYRALDAAPAAYPSPPPLRSMVSGLAAMLALQWLSDRGSMSQVPATMHALVWTGTVSLSSHFVYRVPRCPECFPDEGIPSPWHA